MKNLYNKKVEYNKNISLMKKYIKNGEISLKEIKNNIYNELLLTNISNKTLLLIVDLFEKVKDDDFIDIYCRVKYILSNMN